MAKWFRALVHSATSGICFSVVLSSNPQSSFANSQLVCPLLVEVACLHPTSCLSDMPEN